MINKLEEAISIHDIKLIKNLLEKGADPNGAPEYSLIKCILDELYDEDWSLGLEALKLLFEYGADANFGYTKEEQNAALIFAVDMENLEAVELLLNQGADTNLINEEGDSPLSMALLSCDLDSATVLLKYGAKSYINDYRSVSVYTVLENSVRYCGIDMIKLLLDNGADTSVPSEFNELMVSVLNKSKVEYSKADYNQLKKNLNPHNPPYLKLGEADQDKYIIYENKDKKPWLLADIEEYEEKKYLYHDFSIAYFLDWCVKNSLLLENIEDSMNLAKSAWDSMTHQNLLDMMSNSIGSKLTTDFFTEEGKEFSVGYLTVTNWWYSLYYDLNKLFPVKDHFAQVPEAEESYQIIEKLLDKRFEQFQSGKHFNSNESPAQLQELLGLEVVEEL